LCECVCGWVGVDALDRARGGHQPPQAKNNLLSF
jgi:hypothetical protein